MTTHPSTQSTIGNYRPAFVVADDGNDDRLLIPTSLAVMHFAREYALTEWPQYAGTNVATRSLERRVRDNDVYI